MDDKNASLSNRINEAQQHIVSIFLQQCTYGKQTKDLPSEFAACGQFVAGSAKDIPQRGLHGVAAALRVLGPCPSPECRAIVSRIVSYCEGCFGVNPALKLDPDFQVTDPDKKNVIKLGELLYGLSFVTTAQAPARQLAEHIAGLLMHSQIDGKGWGYFLGEQKVDLLPTAYAVRGLGHNGFDVAAPRKFLLDSLAAPRHSKISPADLTTIVACTYCLTFWRNQPDSTQDSTLEKAFLDVWASLEPLMEEDIEQNLEYWGTTTYYVRIPWQLYLLALAAEYNQWRFAGFRSQRCLNRAINAIRTDSFRYPYSGTQLSSRTNSIAYEVLTAIRERIRHQTWLSVANSIDSFRVFAGSRIVRRSAAVFAAVAIGWSAWQWLNQGHISDLAPHFISPLLLLLLASGRR